MDQCTYEVRLQHWKNIISQYQLHPQGQTAKQWMDENGICEQTYYRWQRPNSSLPHHHRIQMFHLWKSLFKKFLLYCFQPTEGLPLPLSEPQNLRSNSQTVFPTGCFLPSCGRCPIL